MTLSTHQKAKETVFIDISSSMTYQGRIRIEGCTPGVAQDIIT